MNAEEDKPDPEEVFECKGCGGTRWVVRTQNYVEFDSLRKKVVARGVIGSGLVCAECKQLPVCWIAGDLRAQFDRYVKAEDEEKAKETKNELQASNCTAVPGDREVSD